MRLIDADALNREIDKVECYSRDPDVTHMSECIANAPTVDAEPVRHGKWIDEGYYADNTNIKAWHCSECNWHMLGYEDELFRYCPTCGARMVEYETD